MRHLRTVFIIGLLLGFLANAQAEPSHAFLLQGGRQGGTYLLGVQIKLNPGWMTYWRHPGEAGIAPKFEIASSKNIRHLNVKFPLSKEFSESGLKVRGYDKEVVFPLQVTPQKSGKPVHLRLKLSYGVCEKICVPEGVIFDQKLSAKPVPEDLSLITEAQARVPRGEQPLIIK